uniref:SJCHGC09570 protein n=1 Tax=Schistosoma japonicum TaxID=6182 RepID=Q5DH01_SCHJA|nr:SJCHGC09570 protein [Schistosoma japonicum]
MIPTIRVHHLYINLLKHITLGHMSLTTHVHHLFINLPKHFIQPYPTSLQRPSYVQPVSYQPIYSPYRGSVREIYEPHNYSSYSPRRSFSNSRLVDPDTISNNGNTYSYSPNPRPKVEIWHTRGPYEGQYY